MHSLVHAWTRDRLARKDYNQGILKARALLAASCNWNEAPDAEIHSRNLLIHWSAVQSCRTESVGDLRIPEKDSLSWSFHLNQRFTEEQLLL